MINRTNKNSPVTEIQKMLRAISLGGGNIPLINPDGIYGRETSEAVRIFQRNLGLPTTGKVDFTTWNALKLAAENASYKKRNGESLAAFPSPDYMIASGEKSPAVFIVQIILDSISPALDGFEGTNITGEYDGDTESRVKLFQHYCRLEPTGKVDKKTWDEMVKSFNAYSENPNYTS